MITQRYHFKQIESTNQKAKELAKEGSPHGTLVTADMQSLGRGRSGRSWSSEEGAGIYMSMVLRPKMEADKAHMLTLVAAIAVQKAIDHMIVKEQSVKQTPMIKWPNDIVLNKRKVCGILTEMTLKERGIDFVILGIGINVNQKKFPDEISETASSLFLELGQELDKELLIKEVWKQFAVYYQMFLQTKTVSLFKKEYEKGLINKEEIVKVLDPLGEFTGIAKGITDTGELIVDTEGKLQMVSSGEVSVRGMYGYV